MKDKQAQQVFDSDRVFLKSLIFMGDIISEI